jgi:glycosyltransferase involved in cell wall biosynthesis
MEAGKKLFDMKIVQFMASEKWGGAEKVFVDISNELSKRHHVVAIVLRGTEYCNRFSQHVEIRKLSSNSTTHNPFLVFELLKMLKRIAPDIVHTHAVKATLLIHRVNYFTNLYHIATKHNARKGKIFNHLKFVSAVSQEGRQSIQAKNGSVVKVINNGLIPRPATGSLDTTLFRLLAVGRLDAIKGFDILIEQLQSLSFPFLLTIAGEGPERVTLHKKINALGMQDRVVLLGFCEDIPSLMKQSHVVVIASHSEGFPQVMVESLFYGNVLISTPVGGVVEVLSPLFLAEQDRLGQKIEDVYAEYDSFLAHFSTLKKKKTADFHLQKICEDYLAFYEETLR